MLIRNTTRDVAFSAEKMRKVGLFATSRFFLDLYCLEPGQEQRPHTHPDNDKVYVVLEGEVEAEVGGEKCVLGAGDAVLAPAEALHGIANRSTQSAVCLVFMAPNPSAEMQLR